MDAERMCLYTSVFVTLVLGVVIFWGPSTVKRKERRTRISGLVNTGNSCFLNTLLQALASCPILLQWLSEQDSKLNSLTLSLKTVLLILNKKHPTISEDTLLPKDVIIALRLQGWVISAGENDAHELFNAIMTTLEEEMRAARGKEISLADTLIEAVDEIQGSKVPMENIENKNKLTSIIPRETQSDTALIEMRKHCSSTIIMEIASHDIYRNLFIKNNQNRGLLSPGDTSDESSEGKMRHLRPVSGEMQRNNFHDKSLVNENAILGRLISAFQYSNNAPSLPFQGLLTSQLQCTACSHKSPVVYDKFASLSLAFPNLGDTFAKRLTLTHLLDKFVSTEIVKDVTCERCSKQKYDIKTNALKKLKFGKLPKCLCFHIQRTAWRREGQAYKRHDFIEFPEYLSMDAYTYLQRNNQIVGDHGEGKRPGKGFRIKHLYRLTSVVEHTGDIDSGHFVTYRRGAQPDGRWYFTSDADVRECSLKETMSAHAYLLFYGKIL